MKKILTPLFFIHISASLFGQSAYIKGKLVDQKSKETIVGGAIVIDDSTGTVTDINGNYFYTTKSGQHKAEFKSIGFKAQVKSIDLKENDTLVL
ncbi:MAG: carboxypeptidase-like regulatory domain-containing protein, partial [Bacteroidetes bacterium]|nr:carboxypeptidase-like regulatory domain-containing protein [Bacteroidota bacterium]